MNLTPEQRAFLEWLSLDGKYRLVSIDRTGGRAYMAKVRQQCRRKGLAENDAQVNGGGHFASRLWRITDAGRAALNPPSAEGREPK